jgi:hypothetical protein
MNGKLGKYSWEIEENGKTTVWFGQEQIYSDIVHDDPESAVIFIIASMDPFYRKDKTREICQDPLPS